MYITLRYSMLPIQRNDRAYQAAIGAKAGVRNALATLAAAAFTFAVKFAIKKYT